MNFHNLKMEFTEFLFFKLLIIHMSSTNLLLFTNLLVFSVVSESKWPSARCKADITPSLPKKTYSEMSRFFSNQFNSSCISHILKITFGCLLATVWKKKQQCAEKREKLWDSFQNIKLSLISRRCFLIFTCPFLPFRNINLL